MKQTVILWRLDSYTSEKNNLRMQNRLLAIRYLIKHTSYILQLSEYI